MFAYCGNCPINYSDPSGHYLANALDDERIYNPAAMRKTEKKLIKYSGTLSMGLSGSVGVGPWVWGGQACITLDMNGYAAFQYGIAGGGFAGPGADKFSASLIPFIMVTNAKGYRGLEENGIQMGGSMPPFTLDYILLLDSDGRTVTGQGIYIGGWPSSPDAHVMWGYTWTAASVKFDWDTYYRVTQY